MRPSMPPMHAATMPLVAALQTVRDLRDRQIVVTTMGTAREWPRLSQHPLDLHYLPSSMGQAPALALGLALAQPQREVIVLNGDGCTLMNLGCLVTIRASGVVNYTLIVVDNGIYEVTGGQRTAGGAIGFDYAGAARAAGFPIALRFETLQAWQQPAADVLRRPGPRLLHWRVAPVDDYPLRPLGPMAPRLDAFRRALAGD